jgi:DNA ligase-associated metallophosphoesterase
MSDGTVALTVLGEELLLHPERAVLWPRRKTVIVADTHFGKSSYFSRHGIAVPVGTDDADRERLTRLVRESRAERLIILGDFLHAPIDAGSRDALDLVRWAEALAPARVEVVAGNHDRGAQERWSSCIAWRGGLWPEFPFMFVHDASHGESSGLAVFTVSGHIHPVVRLPGSRDGRARIPVFWQRQTGLVLPSFGQFTGGFLVSVAATDQVFAAGPSAVVRLQLPRRKSRGGALP